MADRRSLVEGIAATDASPEQMKDFVFGPRSRKPSPSASEPQAVLPQFHGRVPLTTRVSPETASALKRASLTRQMQGQEPSYVQDIMEEALVAWLKQHDYQV